MNSKISKIPKQRVCCMEILISLYILQRDKLHLYINHIEIFMNEE